tara:strand:- start:106 stop:579 length:474 start_codon:yes stop_codon:yes gene_type:complete
MYIINFFKKKVLIFSLIIFVFLLDRYSKTLVLKNFSENTFYINNFINLDLIWNSGIGFGIFSSNSPAIYNLISGLIFLVIIFLVYYLIKSDKTDKLIFSIIIGGAIGNFYDRLVYKAVPDFIDIHFANFHWFTFNVADIFITLGVIIYLFKGSLIKK